MGADHMDTNAKTGSYSYGLRGFHDLGVSASLRMCAAQHESRVVHAAQGLNQKLR